MSDLTELVLQYFDKSDEADTLQLAEALKEDHPKKLLVINAEQRVTKRLELTDEGKDILTNGSHEAQIFNAVPKNGIPQDQLMSVPNSNIGFSKAMQAGWITIDKAAEGGPKVLRKVESIKDEVQIILEKIHKQDLSDVTETQMSEIKRRKLVAEVKVTSYLVSKGPDFTLKVERYENELTPEMIASGSWKTREFKQYNFDALGVMPPSGHLHPLLKVRSEFRQIFLELGFSEMATNKFVENSFWNFDTLFQPQQHPARDAHDTFFLSDPATASKFPMEYLEKVKDVHEKGGYGSQGYRYEWKLEEAKKNILRTHTTANTARTLYALAMQTPFKPGKFFSIDRVFRNESLDATHLAEFHQIEGVVIDFGLTLGDLMGFMNEFFKKLGIQKLRFKPAYNPYTEPSMEVFSYHEGLHKWVEIGNSGVFRPELLRPMGFPEGVTAIAWGLSVERPTMIKYKIDNIRDLIGPKVDLQMVYHNPLCRLEKSVS
ncbi:hypothetical protein ACJMK2_041519 [Sinanodonta woodiana]|uniref:phenylalanine--tRNA ligase n=1 Tax=Sinanodonta woodiana TaxID=1069815 RepID=A0ABD3W7S1_SINWO